MEWDPWALPPVQVHLRSAPFLGLSPSAERAFSRAISSCRDSPSTEDYWLDTEATWERVHITPRREPSVP
eukprot:371548-Lingulodinium_polyedra.AAC.1